MDTEHVRGDIDKFLGEKTTAFVITSYFLPYSSLSVMSLSATTHEMFPTDRRVLSVEIWSCESENGVSSQVFRIK